MSARLTKSPSRERSRDGRRDDTSARFKRDDRRKALRGGSSTWTQTREGLAFFAFRNRPRHTRARGRVVRRGGTGIRGWRSARALEVRVARVVGGDGVSARGRRRGARARPGRGRCCVFAGLPRAGAGGRAGGAAGAAHAVFLRSERLGVGEGELEGHRSVLAGTCRRPRISRERRRRIEINHPLLARRASLFTVEATPKETST